MTQTSVSHGMIDWFWCVFLMEHFMLQNGTEHNGWVKQVCVSSAQKR